MERLNLHIARELAVGFEVEAIGPLGCGAHLTAVHQIYEYPHRPHWRFLSAAFFRALKVARRRRPDCVLAGSGVTAPIAWIAAKLCGARALAYVHGLDLVATHWVYKIFWRPFLRRMDLCITNSQHTSALAMQIGIPNGKTTVLNPGVELLDTKVSRRGGDFRQRHGFGERKILLSVGRLTPRKGLLEFVQNTLASIIARRSDAILVVIGDEAPDALVGSSVGMAKRIFEAAQAAGLEESVCFLGPCDDATLSAAYLAADVLVFPVRSTPGDVEGFGMVALEAAAHGLPTVAFEVGGVSDAIANGQSGWLVPADDYERFGQRVVQSIEGDDRVTASACREFAAAFAWPLFGEKLRSILRCTCESAS